LNHTWGYHDACEGNGKYSLYDQALRRRYGEPRDVEDYVNKAQLINAESYRAMFEAVNHASDRTAGVILWKANPAWPSVI
jgi:exo-1,4-beta-D-glucosaminidase